MIGYTRKSSPKHASAGLPLQRRTESHPFKQSKQARKEAAPKTQREEERAFQHDLPLTPVQPVAGKTEERDAPLPLIENRPGADDRLETGAPPSPIEARQSA